MSGGHWIFIFCGIVMPLSPFIYSWVLDYTTKNDSDASRQPCKHCGMPNCEAADIPHVAGHP